MFSYLAKIIGWSQEEEEEDEYGDEYDVFLSFNGKDSRKGLIDHLYHHLTDAGLSVFKDNINLRVGEDIASSLTVAIKRSRIVMPVLSKNYANSKWCMDELVWCMLKFRKTMNHMRVIPVFYNVTPSQVRHQTESYAHAFSQHLKMYDLATVDTWKKALAEVASLKGLEPVATDTARSEGQFTRLIVTKVSDELNKADSLVESARIKKHAAKIIRLVNMDGGTDKKMVAIKCSVGSDLKRITYELFISLRVSISSSNNKGTCCSYVKDIGKTALQHNGIERLQIQLVYDLSSSMVANPASVSNDLRHKFCKNKVFIFLHGVGDTHQLDALAGTLDWFGPGSRIIVATRNRHVCNAQQVTDVYHLEKGS